jgi:hypothetical protein
VPLVLIIFIINAKSILIGSGVEEERFVDIDIVVPRVGGE